jgi:hypothetical protein
MAGKPSPYSKAAVAEKLAQTGASEPPVLPPVRAVPMLDRVKFVDHAVTGSARNKPLREVSQSQALLTEDERDRGIWIDGQILVPWSNIRWVEYR